MSIRGLIRIANITQLILLAVLATGLIWLARGQHTLNGMVHEFSHLESLLGELGDSVQQTYADALAFVVTGDKASLEAWQHTLQVAQGEAPRPQSSRLAPGQTVSLNALAEGLILPPGVLDQVRALLNETAQLAYLTEATVGRAMGEARAEGRPPDPEGARRMLRSTGLDRLPLELESRMRALRERWRGDFLNEMKARQASLLPLLAAVLAGLSLLAVSAVINIYVCHTRVVRPLRAVNRYAAAVAAGEDPPPLRLRHQDELAGMFATLQHMQATLQARINALKAAELTARNNRKQAVQARTQALTSLELAQRASRVQDDFLRRISHEIRTPLNAIIGMSYLSLQTELSGVQRDYLAQINKSGSVLLDMVNRILDFSSASEGHVQLEPQPFVLARFVELLRQSVAGAALEKKLDLRFVLDPALPATITGDERHLEEVLRILLDNAVRYTSRGVVECRAQPAPPSEDPIAASAPDRLRLRFVVADTGPGMDAQQLCTVFDPFTPGDESLTRADSGLGLGLALARQLVHLMGGDLQVESVPGKGTTFSFALDFARPQTLAAEPDPAPNPTQLRPVVLVVDDNEINAQISRELLLRAGLEVRLANNGQEALETVRQGGVDVVLMDVQMPVMDGLEATRRIRALGHTPHSLPVIAMTAHTDAASRHDGKAVGMNDYLTKPVDPTALYDALCRWLPGGLPCCPDTGTAPVGPTPDASSPDKTTATASAGDDEKIAPDAARPDATPSDPPINFEAGLATVGGNNGLYSDLLLRFMEHYGDSPRELEALLAAGDYRAAARLAHTVKGVAANLGVERIRKLTTEMEANLPHSAPPQELMTDFAHSMAEALAQISTLQRHGDATTGGQRRLSAARLEALHEVLETLPERMITDWGGAEAALARFAPLTQGTPYAGDVTDILHRLRDFDTEGMARRANLLLERLENPAPSPEEAPQS
ncbi:response regulator [uncultured Desulfovibrio sp.]|uniref:response regulator n=2 Tax=uncultured Desulfovibrio sp. TaxID=167968 RepID=UPI00220DA568|nr:response regulator [uncultured Desulfovibrio sp.]CAI3239286.1 Multi-sensor hybrid histidine kinase [Desulfovibrio diazotrophicus]